LKTVFNATVSIIWHWTVYNWELNYYMHLI